MNDTLQWSAIVAIFALQLIVFKRLGDLERNRSDDIELLPDLGPAVGSNLPAVELRLLGGGDFRLASLISEMWLLVFVTDTCTYCAEILPSLDETAVERSGLRLATFDISGNKKEQNPPYLQQYGLPGPQYVVDRAAVQDISAIGISATPSYIVIDGDLKVLDKGVCGSEGWNTMLSGDFKKV